MCANHQVTYSIKQIGNAKNCYSRRFRDQILVLRQYANSAQALSLNGHKHCGGYQNHVCE
jgi:hypothetical protein